MGRCQCRCHPINHTEAAQFLSDHLAANHGRVTTSLEYCAIDQSGAPSRAELKCDCGASTLYDSGDVPAFVPEYDRG